MSPRAHLELLATLAPIACAAACGGGRTTAATQPSPKAFEPSKSDPKAIAIVDQMMAALGGQAAWDKAKQIQWDQKYYRDGKLAGQFRHAWDRWNGRHHFEEYNLASIEKAQREGKPDEVSVVTVMYELFDHAGKGYAMKDGNPLPTTDRDHAVDSAYKQWRADSYRIFAPYKLKDPGVILALDAPREPIKGLCTPTCDVLKVTFVPEVGTDTWYVAINSQSHLPEILERDVPAEGGQAGGRLGFGLSAWTTAGGIKVPGKLENLGMSESFEVGGVEVGDPDDDLYIPQVQ